VKIGFSSNVAKRFHELQSANPEKLVLYAAIPGSYGLEKLFHQVLAPWNERGEWFTLGRPSPLRKILVLIDSGARPTCLADIEMLCDFAPASGCGRGMGGLQTALKGRALDIPKLSSVKSRLGG